MREILFRGKRIYDSLFSGKWVFGSYIKSPTFNEERGDWHLIGVYEDCLIVPVDKDTVSEFTGLCDKNGNRIFEGDIVKWIEYEIIQHIDEVTFDNGKFKAGDFSLAMITLCYVEVIGNKWDNKSLLENEQWKR